MKRQKLTSIISAFVLSSQMLSSVAVGQVVQTNQKNEGSVKAVNSVLNSPKYVQDVSQLVREGRFPWSENLKQETKMVENALTASADKGVIVIDRQGNKNAGIVGNIAAFFDSENAPQNLRGKRIWKLDLSAVVTDAKNTQQVEARVQKALRQAESAKEKVILYVEDISAFSRTNPLFGAEVAKTIRKSLAEGKIRVISSSSVEDYNEQIAADTEIRNRFKKVELSGEETASDDGFVGDKISPDLRELMASAAPNQKAKVILQADDIRNPQLLAVLKRNNVVIADRAESLNMLSVELPVAAAEEVAALSGAKHLSLDREMRTLGHIATTTGMAAMRFQPGNISLDGTGVGIAIVDSGVYEQHKSFMDRNGNDRLVKSVDFTGENITGKDPYGHGSHVAGLAAGSSGDQGSLINYVGLATNAKIISVRVLKRNGTGTSSSLLQGLDWILANRAAYNIRVVNLSLGTPAIESYRNDPLCRAVRKLADAGIVVVAAGNNGKDANGQKIYGAIHSPGNDPSVITVGATNTFGTDARNDDGIATYSSRGPTRSYYTDAQGVKQFDHVAKPDLVAPGNKLISVASAGNALLTANPSIKTPVAGNASDELMMTLSGTSMATPIVAGTAALMLQANPKLTPNMVKMILEYTAQPLRGFNMLEQGAGELNVEGAIRLSKLVRQNLPLLPLLGDSLLTTATLPTMSSTIGGTTFQWSGGIMVDKGYVTGTNLISKYQKVYGQGLLMSDDLLMSDGLLMSDATFSSSSPMIAGDDTAGMQ